MTLFLRTGRAAAAAAAGLVCGVSSVMVGRSDDAFFAAAAALALLLLLLLLWGGAAAAAAGDGPTTFSTKLALRWLTVACLRGRSSLALLGSSGSRLCTRPWTCDEEGKEENEEEEEGMPVPVPMPTMAPVTLDRTPGTCRPSPNGT